MNPTASSRPSAYVRPAALDGRHFSTVIIGAGINGVGVFRDLSLQGVDCLVVDKGDIASGASSAPSRMIHGGLRYLEHGSFALVAEATHERNLLLRNAPHLVRPLKTVVPLSNRFGGFMGGRPALSGRPGHRQPARPLRGLARTAPVRPARAPRTGHAQPPHHGRCRERPAAAAIRCALDRRVLRCMDPPSGVADP